MKLMEKSVPANDMWFYTSILVIPTVNEIEEDVGRGDLDEDLSLKNGPV